ncbi:MAG TPA: YkgJ family cysteine cluster protein [Steroidobacteraceae bacterium]|nr:YkgJ family cysteine cluster protein [Steroidobacteraceae bacterium]
MEFTIDLHLIRRLIVDERARADADIREGGPITALARSQTRHDERLAAAADAHTLACRAGCSWCCNFTIDVRAAEVFRILDHLATLPATEQQRLRGRIERNAERLAGLDEDERARMNIECAFLSNGRCTIYSVRPQTCRNYHATDASGCKQAFEQPENEDIDPDFAPYVYQIGHAHVEAFAKALADARFDSDVYELNAALNAALNEPSTRSRFLSKVQPFTDLGGMEVPPAFLEDEE